MHTRCTLIFLTHMPDVTAKNYMFQKYIYIIRIYYIFSMNDLNIRYEISGGTQTVNKFISNINVENRDSYILKEKNCFSVIFHVESVKIGK